MNHPVNSASSTQPSFFSSPIKSLSKMDISIKKVALAVIVSLGLILVGAALTPHPLGFVLIGAGVAGLLAIITYVALKALRKQPTEKESKINQSSEVNPLPSVKSSQEGIKKALDETQNLLGPKRPLTEKSKELLNALLADPKELQDYSDFISACQVARAKNLEILKKNDGTLPLFEFLKVGPESPERKELREHNSFLLSIYHPKYTELAQNNPEMAALYHAILDTAFIDNTQVAFSDHLSTDWRENDLNRRLSSLIAHQTEIDQQIQANPEAKQKLERIRETIPTHSQCDQTSYTMAKWTNIELSKNGGISKATREGTIMACEGDLIEKKISIPLDLTPLKIELNETQTKQILSFIADQESLEGSWEKFDPVELREFHQSGKLPTLSAHLQKKLEELPLLTEEEKNLPDSTTLLLERQNTLVAIGLKFCYQFASATQLNLLNLGHN